MSGEMRIDYVEAALLALVNETVPTAYKAFLPPEAPGGRIDIDSLGDKDFDENGMLVLDPPSIRIRFAGAEYDTLRDNRRLTYQAAMPFEILCFESSLRGKADQRKQTLVLVAAVLDQLVGANLRLSDGSTTMPLTLLGVQLIGVEAGPVDQLFAVGIQVPGIAQFGGPNAQTGGS